MKIGIFDTETTGLLRARQVPLEYQPKIIELSLLIVDLQGKELDCINQLINPEQPIPADALKVSKIFDADVKDMPTFKAYFPTLREKFDGLKVLIAHNMPFDSGMLANELKRLGENETFPWPPHLMCTVQEYRHRFGFRPTLAKLYELIVGEPLMQTHRAIDDVRALNKILVKDNFIEKIGKALNL